MDKDTKSQFTKELGELFAKYNINYIDKMEYERNENVTEYVKIFYDGGENFKKINVTLDSLKGMVVDIVKQGGLD